MPVVLLAPALGWGADLTVQVVNVAGVPLANTAVYAEPQSGNAAARPSKPIQIEQKARKFSPLVSVVQVGTPISFPNNDSVRHHVYSFSPAKTFELKLYSGVPSMPVVFDKPGTVVLGCNIHDKMVAYVHVVGTPYFALTDDDGKAVLQGLPAGRYTLKAWHTGLPATAPIAEQAIGVTEGGGSATFRIDAKPGPAAP